MKISLLEPIGIPEEMVRELAAGFEQEGHSFTYYDTKTTDVEELKRRSAGQDIVMIANNPYPDEVVEAADSLKMIAVAFTGIDHVGLKACRDKGVTVCNCAGYSNQSVAELAIGMTIELLRRFRKCDEASRTGLTGTGLTGEEMRGLIHSACSARFCSTPKEMKQAIENARMVTDRNVTGIGTKASADGYSDIEEEQNNPPALPKRLPPLIRLLISRTPDIYKPAVAHAVFPSLAAHLHRTRFRYIDNVWHEATLMNVLMAGTGAGKDCISEPINRIMADIRRRDEENLRREREWKNEVSSKGANKDKRARPEGLVIQEIDADMTNPAFVMRTAEADGHFLYTKLNEIDQFDALKGSGRSQQQFQIMCLAFDPGNRYGQTRVGTQSVTEKVTIRFNWNASTTILKGKRYFSRVLTDGPVSRINFCTIPEREKFAVIDRLFPASLRTFLKVVCRNGQIDSIAEIFSEYIRLARQERQCAHAVLEYVTPLTAAQLAAMKQVVCAKTGKTEAELELRKNDELEGGFVLHIGDDTYDRSVRGIARYMRRRLIRR